MTVLVTGVAGFVGSTLAERLASEGQNVRGVDCLTSYYDVSRKQDNLAALLEYDNFEFVNADLHTTDLSPLFEDISVVYHQAGQPGVRLSWSNGFEEYVRQNVSVTQRLLEAAKTCSSLERFVYASSSSIYGNAERYPTSELDVPAPYSPYGVTKLAAEHLCSLYASNWKLPTVSLRYFTVYGPKQRPDMAFCRLMEAAVTGKAFPLNGSGEQRRDFTFVDDVVRANIAAGSADIAPGEVFNVAGGGSVTMNEVIQLVEHISGKPLNLDRKPDQAGDVKQTGGSIDKAIAMLDWKPAIGLEEGLRAHYEWTNRRFAKLSGQS